MHFLYVVAAVTAVTVNLDHAAQAHKAEEHKAEEQKVEPYPAFPGTDTDALYSHAAGVDDLHEGVQGVHERLAELLALPRESGALHSPNLDSPLNPHERFLEILKGLGVKKETRDAIQTPHDEEPAPAEEPSEKKKAAGAMEKKALHQMGNSLK